MLLWQLPMLYTLLKQLPANTLEAANTTLAGTEITRQLVGESRQTAENLGRSQTTSVASKLLW